jgi:tetratricopeptide (TPR) repeat protein
MCLLLIEIALRSILPPFYSLPYLESVCRRKLGNNPNNTDVLWFLGNVYAWYGKYSEARPLLEALIESGKDSRGIRLALSRVYYRLGEHDKLYRILTQLDILNENDVENYYLGDSLIESKRYLDAITYLETYVNHNHKEYIPFVRLGYAYFMAGKYKDALRAYHMADKIKPSLPEIKDGISICLKKLEETNNLFGNLQ